MSGNVSLSAREFDRLMAAAQAYPENAEKAINDVLHKQAGPLISQRINPLIHPSGRTFKGHRASAVASDWPRYDIDENLAVSVGTKRRWRYLYFPDDGSNTKNHAGGQHFFLRGAQAASPEVVQRCIDAMTREWSE